MYTHVYTHLESVSSFLAREPRDVCSSLILLIYIVISEYVLVGGGSELHGRSELSIDRS